MDIPIIYEDDDVVVVNKPAGLAMHADGRTPPAGGEPTLADWVLAQYPQTKDVGESLVLTDGREIARPGIVHRLDRDTSGVVVVAKTGDAHTYLKAQFQSRRAHKEYRAFIHGAPKEKSGTINKPIGRSPKDFRRWSAQPGARGTLREAVTDYQILEESTDGAYAYVALFPKTGRTHQLRVHLKAIHHSVVCDSLYGPNQPCALDFTRLALHAYKLTVALPAGEERLFEAPLPADFAHGLEILRGI